MRSSWQRSIIRNDSLSIALSVSPSLNVIIPDNRCRFVYQANILKSSHFVWEERNSWNPSDWTRFPLASFLLSTRYVRTVCCSCWHRFMCFHAIYFSRKQKSQIFWFICLCSACKLSPEIGINIKHSHQLYTAVHLFILLFEREASATHIDVTFVIVFDFGSTHTHSTMRVQHFRCRNVRSILIGLENERKINVPKNKGQWKEKPKRKKLLFNNPKNITNFQSLIKKRIFGNINSINDQKRARPTT